MKDSVIERYLDYCRAVKLSLATISNYRRGLLFFSDYLKSEGKSLTNAQTADVANYITLHPEWDTATVCCRLSALRSFYQWAQVQHLLTGENPMLSIRSPKHRICQNKPSVTAEEMRLLTQTRYVRKNGQAYSTDLRDRCLIALIADSGLRVTEAASLTVGQILGMDPRQRAFTYIGKGGGEYRWYLSEDVYHMLLHYVRTLGEPDGNQPLFINRDGKRLSVRSMQQILKRRGQDILGRRVHPHMLRRGFGNAFYEASGHDIYATSQAMHHANITTTQGYLGISPETLKGIVDVKGSVILKK